MAKLRNNIQKLLLQKYGDQKAIPSQQELARLIGVSQTTISRWLGEKVDRFDADILEKFCRFFECNIGDLMYLEFDR